MRVTPGSPAHRIGLKSNDEVTEIGDMPTSNLSLHQAQELINQYVGSIILTVERRATGAIPRQPVLNQPQTPELKDYQTFDMSGAKPAPRHRPRPPQSYDFNTAVARPFEDTYQQRHMYQPQPAPMNASPVPLAHAPVVSPAPPMYHRPTHMVPEEDKRNDGVQQSRTFRILQTVMHDQEPSGTFGLPPPRSAEMERRRQEQKAQSGQRMKVFMPQQYNSPIGMYSAHNLVDTFQTQAEMQLQELERKGDGQ